MPHFTPPTISPPTEELGILDSLRAMRENALNILPQIAFTQPIVSGKTGFKRWHMVQGPEGMRQVFLANADNYPKADVITRMLRTAVGQSLFTSEGPAWRWQRRAISPVFAARNVNALAPIMTRTAERACERIAARAQTGPVEMVREMISATFDVICEVALSGKDHFDADHYGAAITHYMLTAGRASLLDFIDAPAWMPRPGELFAQKSVHTMHKMVKQAIIERQQTGAGSQEDLLDYMIKAKDPDTGRKMSVQDLVHNMQFFIVAGHETTALALSWALYLLAHDKTIQNRAQQQVQSVLKDGQAASLDDIDKAPYLEQILLETMRLYPPVGFLARKAREKDRLYDREVRPNDTVFLNLYSLHRHHLYWEQPDQFNPDHFAPENVATRDKFLYVPFGGGPRICVGANFAMMQAQIILMTLLAKFSFEPEGPAPTPVMHMTIRPDPGITLTLKPTVPS